MTPRFAFAMALVALTACKGGSSPCAPGQPDCPCTALGTCEDGLDCFSNTCVSPRETEVSINGSEARACEFVMRDGQSRVTGIEFSERLQGTHIRRGARTAVTFIARQDVAIAGGVIVRSIPAAEGGSGSELEIEESRCFDRIGEEITGSSISL